MSVQYKNEGAVGLRPMVELCGSRRSPTASASSHPDDRRNEPGVEGTCYVVLHHEVLHSFVMCDNAQLFPSMSGRCCAFSCNCNQDAAPPMVGENK